MKILKLNRSEHAYGTQVKMKHSAIAILTIPRADLIVIEEVTVIETLGILDKGVIAVIIVQKIKPLAKKINGDAKPVL